MRSLLREPIFDLQERLHGYELAPDVDGEPSKDDPQALRTVLDNLVLFGFDRLTGGLPGYIRCTEEMLTERLVAVLPPEMVVLEVPENVEVTAKVLEACCELREAGFRFALADCTHPVRNSLLELADYVKVDFSTGNASGAELRQWLQGTTLALMAEGIHSERDYRQARIGGFSCFQGFRLCGRELLRNAKPPANRQVHVDILHELFRDRLDVRQICPLVMRDPALVYRLLRLVDSYLHRQIESIESAILMLGEPTFRRLAILAIQCELDGGPPPEVVYRALVRARFCASAARMNKLNPDEQYLLGMASLFPAMLGISVDAMSLKLPLRPPIIEALLGVPVPERRLLNWIESQEQGAFSERYAPASIPDRNQSQLVRSYHEALAWEATRAATPQQARGGLKLRSNARCAYTGQRSPIPGLVEATEAMPCCKPEAQETR